MGASSGGIQALIEVVSGLPKDLPAALFVVLHVPAEQAAVIRRLLLSDKLSAPVDKAQQT
jgi:two-component system chemotaxis response regulator CheB